MEYAFAEKRGVDESVYDVDNAKREPMSNADVPANAMRTIDLNVVSAHVVAPSEPSLDCYGAARWSAFLLPPELATHRLIGLKSHLFTCPA